MCCLSLCRRAVYATDCTLATYAERFDDKVGWMGQMMLESVVNVPYDRYPVPMEAINLHMLLSGSMKWQRIHSLKV